MCGIIYAISSSDESTSLRMCGHIRKIRQSRVMDKGVVCHRKKDARK